MSVSTFDTLAATDALRDAGLQDAPARAIVNTVRDAVGGKVATKADLAALEGRFEARPASAVDKMLLAQIAVGGVVVALVKLFWFLNPQRRFRRADAGTFLRASRGRLHGTPGEGHRTEN